MARLMLNPMLHLGSLIDDVNRSNEAQDYARSLDFMRDERSDAFLEQEARLGHLANLKDLRSRGWHALYRTGGLLSASIDPSRRISSIDPDEYELHKRLRNTYVQQNPYTRKRY